MLDPRPKHQQWIIDSPEKLMWSLDKYEEGLKVSRYKSRYLFNCLFDYGMKVIDNKINLMIKLGPRPLESFNMEERNDRK